MNRTNSESGSHDRTQSRDQSRDRSRHHVRDNLKDSIKDSMKESARGKFQEGFRSNATLDMKKSLKNYNHTMAQKKKNKILKFKKSPFEP